MIVPSRALSLGSLAALALVSGPAFGAGATTRECLAQAAQAAQAIQLPGDQSAARRYLAVTLAGLDPRGALEIAGGVGRPSDAARALAAVSAALTSTDPSGAKQAATAAARLLQRISEPARREQEQRLLLEQVAILGQAGLEAAPELTPEEARLTIVIARSRSDPAAAAGLLAAWQLAGQAVDRADASVALGLARSAPDQSLKLAAAIGSDRLRDQVLWCIAEARPPAETSGIAQRVVDPIVRSALLSSAAVRLASEDADAALAMADEVLVASDSTRAEIAAALASTDLPRALGLARGLPELAQRWALGQIALDLAGSDPDQAERLVKEAGATPELVRVVATRMAAKAPARGLQMARAQAAGEAQDAALAAIAPAIAAWDPRQATELLWAIKDPDARSRAIAAVVTRIAPTDADAATSLLGLVPDQARAFRLRAAAAALVGERDPAAAARLLGTLPPSAYRSEAALQAACAFLAAGGEPHEVLQLAELGTGPDLMLRWALPSLALTQAASPLAVGDLISDPYLRALALIEVSRRLQGVDAEPVSSSARARMVRLAVEWEGA